MDVTLKDVLSAIETQRTEIERRFTEQGAKLEGYDAAMADLNVKIAEVQQKLTPNRVSLPGCDEGKKQFSFFNLFRGMMTNDWSDAGFEREVCTEAAKKALGTTTGASGGYIVPQEYINQIIELLRPQLISLALGVTEMGGLTASPIEIPKVVSGTSQTWLAENTALTETTMALGQLTLSPKMVGSMIKMSNRVVRMSDPSVEALVRADLARSMAETIDLIILRGTGVSGQPLGITNTTGINTVTAGSGNGDTVTWDDIMDMEYELEVDNALSGKLGYAMHPAIRRYLMQLKIQEYTGQTSQMGYMMLPALHSETTFKDWLGYPYKTTTQIPVNLVVGSGTNCTEIFFCDWSQVILALWGGMEFLATNTGGTSFEYVQTWIRVIQELDVAVRRPVSCCLISDAKIA